MKSITRIAPVVALFLVAVPSFAQKPKAKPPVKKKPGFAVLGHAQVAGGDGLFGTTYTVENSGGYRYNLTLTSAEYSVERHNIAENSVLIPKADEKLLILHFKAQNPKAEDEYFSSNFITFSTVAKDDKTRDHNDYLRLVSAKEPIATSLKPGQRFPEEILAGCLVPAKGPVPKLIMNMGRVGTKEEVVRYFLGTKPNSVKPLAAPFADSSDATGATALSEIPAQIGTVYPAGYYDFRVDSIAFTTDAIGDEKPEDGKRFLVVTLSVTNKTWSGNYFNDSIAAKLSTADDEKTEEFTLMKGKRNERWEGRKIDPEETVSMRLLFRVPQDTMGKTLRLAELTDNTGTQSHAFLFDLSAIK